MESAAKAPAEGIEVVQQPPYGEWAALVDANRRAAEGWAFRVGGEHAGMPAAEMRSLARRETLELASLFSARLGVPVAAPGDPGAPIVATGHQPELYHPGVWAKDFLLQRLARETGATAFDLVVDTDGFESVGIEAPCLSPHVRRCRVTLAGGGANGYFAGTAAPTEEDAAEFCRQASADVVTMPAVEVADNFERFCSCLLSASRDATNLAELVTFARRRYEASASTDYLELPMTMLAETEAYLRFAADVIGRAEEFRSEWNEELATYRSENAVRNPAQPVPDLGFSPSGAIELPFWLLGNGVRETAYAGASGPDGVSIETADGEVAGVVPTGLGARPEAAIEALRDLGALLAPKALSLTLFTRMFACDLLIHGTGGGRYDRVTDGIIRRFYLVEPPAYVVASMTAILPLGLETVDDAQVSGAKERLNRLEHNPDALLGEIEFESEEARRDAMSLADEKSRLVAAIAEPGADKKALGRQIRSVNERLGKAVAPVRVRWEVELAELEEKRSASEILEDRRYPFCFWDPEEIAEMLR